MCIVGNETQEAREGKPPASSEMQSQFLSDGVTIVVIDAKPSPAVRDTVAAKLTAGKCLHCDKAIHARGCCKRHYLQYLAARNAKPERDRPTFEAKQIRAGKIAKERRGHRSVKNPFSE